MVGLAATFLQRTIFVVEFLTGETYPWRCRKFTPKTVTRHRRRVVTAAEYPLDIMAFMDAVIAAKIDDPRRPPLLLLFQDRHYSAFNHSGDTSLLPDLAKEIAPRGLPESSPLARPSTGEAIYLRATGLNTTRSCWG